MADALVIGGSGLVGGELLARLPDAVGTYYRHPQVERAYDVNTSKHERVLSVKPELQSLDLADGKQVIRLISVVNPKTIYLAGALTAVDYCETHSAESYAVNVMGVKAVVDAANNGGARVVFFSTDHLFDGKNGPYHEWDAANPVNVYGQQKLMAEHYIMAQAHSYLIVRTTCVYGHGSDSNLVARMIAAPNKMWMGAQDEMTTPTYAPDLAEQVLATHLDGVLNLTGQTVTSRYEFMKEAARLWSPDMCIKGVLSADLWREANRPLNGGLADGGLPDYVDGLRRMRDVSVK